MCFSRPLQPFCFDFFGGVQALIRGVYTIMVSMLTSKEKCQLFSYSVSFSRTFLSVFLISSICHLIGHNVGIDSLVSVLCQMVCLLIRVYLLFSRFLNLALCRYGANANVFGELGFYSWGLNTSQGHCQLIYMRKPF